MVGSAMSLARISRYRSGISFSAHRYKWMRASETEPRPRVNIHRHTHTYVYKRGRRHTSARRGSCLAAHLGLKINTVLHRAWRPLLKTLSLSATRDRDIVDGAALINIPRMRPGQSWGNDGVVSPPDETTRRDARRFCSA